MEASAGPQRVQELWFEDGNIILQAGNFQCRVFRGILAARSPVFQDMFSFPQPLDSELVEGCPVILIPDHPSEVKVFLKAIFDPEYVLSLVFEPMVSLFLRFLLPHPAHTTFEAITGCVRLSHKYGVDYLRRRALIQLSSLFPTNLADYDAMWIENTTHRSWSPPDDETHHIFLFQLAREIEALWILPYIFYSLAFYFRALGTEIFHGVVYNGIPVALSAQDQRDFVNGYTSQLATNTLAFLHHPLNIPGCLQPEHCSRIRLGATSFVDLHRRSITFAIPLHSWLPTDWPMLGTLCPTCLDTLKQMHQAARQNFWDKLPSMYGLSSWPELEKCKRESAAIETDTEA